MMGLLCIDECCWSLWGGGQRGRGRTLPLAQSMHRCDAHRQPAGQRAPPRGQEGPQQTMKEVMALSGKLPGGGVLLAVARRWRRR